MADSPIDTETLCLDILRDIDRDRYLACLLSPKEKRGALAALYAFNAELARIRDLVHEPLPGEIRLQYWRDLLSGGAHGSTEANPIAAGLLNTVETYRLPIEPLQAMVEARLFDLYDDAMESRSMFEGYAGETASALIQLAAVILDPTQAAGCAEIAGHAGIAQSVAGQMLLMPRQRARGQIFIPLDILSATGLDRDGFLAGIDGARIAASIDAFAGLGFEHLQKARRAGRIPASLMPAFLTASLAEPVLKSARRAGIGVFSRDLRPSQWRRQWRMFKASTTRSI
ncbi:phytoene/squalene synthase family protein [Agrobacterium sp. ES01]|uniref:phytoene/squalene synthase family protein n=1 Tax=Agrobacterium sp. ES01 TaxID=3420714 RepID=UPI003D0A5D64